MWSWIWNPTNKSLNFEILNVVQDKGKNHQYAFHVQCFEYLQRVTTKSLTVMSESISKYIKKRYFYVFSV